MSKTENSTTIAGVHLNPHASYVGEIDIDSELEVVSCLRKLSNEEFTTGMNMLAKRLHNVPTAFLADRYINVLVRMAEGEPNGNTTAAA